MSVIITCCQFSKRTNNAHKEAELPVHSSEENTSKGEIPTQATLSENAGADEMQVFNLALASQQPKANHLALPATYQIICLSLYWLRRHYCIKS